MHKRIERYGKIFKRERKHLNYHLKAVIVLLIFLTSFVYFIHSCYYVYIYILLNSIVEI